MMIIQLSLATLLALSQQPAAAAEPAEPTGKIAGKVTSKLEREDAVWVVYVSDLNTTKADREAAKQGKYSADQRNTRFEPRVLVVPAGAEVQFPNSDKFFHNVFSMSEPNVFDLGLYRSGEGRSAKMRKAGEVDVYCNIHPQMNMKILVVPNRFYTAVGADGTFRLEGVPAGDRELTAWSSEHKPVTIEIAVPENGTAKATVEITEKRKSAAGHLRKDGSQYVRYE